MSFGSMNGFRISADVLHLISYYFILHKIITSKNASGISLKSQELSLIVFLTRYADIIWDHSSVYNTGMKIMLTLSTVLVIYAVRYFNYPNKAYEKNKDSFSTIILLAPSLAISATLMRVHHDPTIFEYFWTFSICLESVSILPQLYLLAKAGCVENLTSHYVAFLGAYRALYVANWLYRKHQYNYDTPTIVWTSGLIQIVLYIDFFYHYCKSKHKYGLSSEVVLPV